MLAQLGEAEQGQKTLTAPSSVTSSEDPNTLRNTLKVIRNVRQRKAYFGVSLPLSSQKRLYKNMFFYFLLQAFSTSLTPLQRVVEDINDQASDFTANNVALSRQILQRLEDINTR